MTFWQIAGIAAGIAIGIISAIFGIGVWVGRINTRVSSNSAALEKINDNLLKIFDRLPSVTVVGASPKKLTELGEQIAREVDAYNWAKRAVTYLSQDVLNMEDYEIYDWCVHYAFDTDNLDGRTNELISRTAYEHGINITEVLAVFPIVLRDTIIEAKGKRTWTE